MTRSAREGKRTSSTFFSLLGIDRMVIRGLLEVFEIQRVQCLSGFFVKTNLSQFVIPSF